MAETRDQDRQGVETSNLAFVMLPRFNMMALTATLEPLRIANYLTGRPLYDWRFLSVSGGLVPASNGMTLDTQALDGDGPRPLRVFLCASPKAFRARILPPHGGEGHFVVGPFDGHLATGDVILLRDPTGRVRCRIVL